MILLIILLYLTFSLGILIINNNKFNVLGCGLVGYSGDVEYDKDKLAILFLYNESRGKDSTGMFDGTNIIKRLDPVSFNFLVDDYIDIKPSKFVIGHTRAKTHGAININNSHPFIYNDTIMAHNGTLSNWINLKDLHEIEENFDVDSQVICYLLDKYKNERVLTEIVGAAALLYTRASTPNTLFVFRTEERPLFRGTIKENGTTKMYISSISSSLSVIGCSNIQSFDTNRLYTIIDGKIKSTNKISVNNKKLPIVAFDYLRSKSSIKYNEHLISVKEAIDNSNNVKELEDYKDPIKEEGINKFKKENEENKEFIPIITDSQKVGINYITASRIKSSGKIQNVLDKEINQEETLTDNENYDDSSYDNNIIDDILVNKELNEIILRSNSNKEVKEYLQLLANIRSEIFDITIELSDLEGKTIFDYENACNESKDRLDFMCSYIDELFLEISKSCKNEQEVC